MTRFRDRRARPRGAGRRRAHPRIEGLEGRLLLFATNGGEWVHGERITYSFAPDGTDVGGTPSNLDAAMAARGLSAHSWRDQFRRAFAAWQVVADINLVEVPDDGSPLSISGNQQNDPRFGDIRIAGIDSDPGVLGLSFLPPVLNGGTLAGDIILNADILWNVNSDYDLRSVALHEVGHSLGLAHSTASQTVMSYAYAGVQQSLKTDDINGIRSIYGPRQPDALEGPLGNNTNARATPIAHHNFDAALQARFDALDITAATDHDWFYVVAPDGASNQLTVTMQSDGLSSLGPRVQLYNASLRGIADASASAFGATVTVGAAGIQPGQGFYIRAMPSGGGATAGAYGLIVNFGTDPAEPIAPPDTTVPEQADFLGGATSMLRRVTSRLPHILPGLPRLPTAPPLTSVGNLLGYADVFGIEGHDHDHDGPGHPGETVRVRVADILVPPLDNAPPGGFPESPRRGARPSLMQSIRAAFDAN
jgi:hypothetical protein